MLNGRFRISEHHKCKIMNFKSIASPAPSPGVPGGRPKLVTPDMSISLEEILRRFTRGEPLEIGRDGLQYDDDGDVDLEKLKHMDLVDRQEFAEKLKATTKQYEKEQKAREKREKERLDKLAVEKIAADKLAASAAEKAK